MVKIGGVMVVMVVVVVVVVVVAVVVVWRGKRLANLRRAELQGSLDVGED